MGDQSTTQPAVFVAARTVIHPPILNTRSQPVHPPAAPQPNTVPTPEASGHQTISRSPPSGMIPSGLLNYQQLLVETRKYQRGISQYLESLRSKSPKTPRDYSVIAFSDRVLVLCSRNDPRDEPELRAAYNFIIKNNRAPPHPPSTASRSTIHYGALPAQSGLIASSQAPQSTTLVPSPAQYDYTRIWAAWKSKYETILLTKINTWSRISERSEHVKSGLIQCQEIVKLMNDRNPTAERQLSSQHLIQIHVYLEHLCADVLRTDTSATIANSLCQPPDVNRTVPNPSTVSTTTTDRALALSPRKAATPTSFQADVPVPIVTTPSGPNAAMDKILSSVISMPRQRRLALADALKLVPEKIWFSTESLAKIISYIPAPDDATTSSPSAPVPAQHPSTNSVCSNSTVDERDIISDISGYLNQFREQEYYLTDDMK